VHGEVAWEKLEIRLLPSPRGALTRVRAEIPETVSVRAAEVDVLLRLLPLLRGRTEIASVRLSKPVIRVEIAPSPAAKDIRLRRLEVRAKTGSGGLEVELAAESEYWSGFKLSAQVAFPDLSGTASLKIAEDTAAHTGESRGKGGAVS
jgi:hypothetical protein